MAAATPGTRLRLLEEPWNVRGRGTKHRVGPGHGPLSPSPPELVEGLLHPSAVELGRAAGNDCVEIDIDGLDGVVGSLAGDRIVEHHRVGNPEHRHAGGQYRDRVPDSRSEAAAQHRAFVGRCNAGAARVFIGEMLGQNLFGARQMLIGRVDVIPAVHRAARHRLEHHHVTGTGCGQRGEHEVLADPGHNVQRQIGAVRVRIQAVYVCQRRALAAAGRTAISPGPA